MIRLKLDVAASDDWGLREHMEDRFYFDLNFRDQGELFAGVYDGHGGDEVAKYAESNLHGHFASLLGNSFNYLEAFAITYEHISKEVCDLGFESGTCAANLVLSHGKVYFANTGDVRILVVGSDVQQLTIDHHPNVPEEKERIKQCGGIITKKRIASVFGSLALSRAIGDINYQSSGVIATPHTGIHFLRSNDVSLVLASDGVFEQMTNEEVAKIARSNRDAKSISKSIVKAALDSGSNDNLTALVIKIIK